MNKISKLSELLHGLVPLSACYSQTILGLALDSRKVKQHDMFFAFSGSKLDGRDYIDEAIQKGAAAVLCESEKDESSKEKQDEISAITKYSAVLNCDVPIFHVPQLRKIMGSIAARFYGYPNRDMTVIGVTGTNGKTSVSQLIAKMLNDLNYPCGVIGTLGVGFPENLIPLEHHNTTPDVIALHQQFNSLHQAGAKAVALEVSSHGLVQDRIQGTECKIGVFTNLTRDHLDYHSDMQSYGAAKRLLFLQPGLQHAVINVDDEFGRELLKSLPPSLTAYCYGLNAQSQDVKNKITVDNIKINQKNNGNYAINAHIFTPWGDGELRSNLLGRFNLSNLLAVITVLGIMKFDLKEILEKIALLQPLPGRMQALGGKNNKPLVVVDYAHTPDALEQALLASREYCRGNLWCVFGCGGDRDRGKRPLMGQIAERCSDNIIITDDNPRTENPEQIVADIVKGLLCPWAVEIEHDRRAAITHALDCANAEDVILIAGKGHENYQIIGHEQVPFDDVELVITFL